MPGLDYVVMWILVLADTLGLILVVRHLALQPLGRAVTGPKLGMSVPPWSPAVSDTTSRAEPPDAYTLLFLSASCSPCRQLLETMRDAEPDWQPLYIVARTDLEGVAHLVAGITSLSEQLIVDNGGELFAGLSIPGTPWAVSVRSGRVAAAGPASDVKQLRRVAHMPPNVPLAEEGGAAHPVAAPRQTIAPK